MITQQELKELYHYDPDTGIFTRLINPRMGSKPRKDGYIQLGIGNKKQEYAHRLAWLYMTGKMPLVEIDHINRVRHDNRFVNLREATHHQNKPGYKGKWPTDDLIDFD